MLALLVVLWAMASRSAHADIITWTDADWLNNEDGQDSWSDSSGNWQTGSSNQVPTITDTAVFNSGINDYEGNLNTVFVDSSGLSVGNIFFDTNAFLSTSGTEVGYTIEDETGLPSYSLTLGTSGTIGILSTFAGSGVTQTIAVPLLLSGNATFSNNAAEAGDLLLFSGSIAGTVATGTSTITLSGNGLGTISGNISNGSGGGSVGVTDNSTSTWTLSGNNSYTGGTIVNSGTFVLSATNNFGTGTVTINNAAATISANNTMGGATLNGGTLTMAGNNTMTGGTLAVNGGTATVSGNNAFGTGSIEVSAGMLTLGGANTMSSGASVVITGGTLSTSAYNNIASGTPTISLSGGGTFLQTTVYNPNGTNFTNSITLGAGGGVWSTSNGGDVWVTSAITGGGGLTLTAGDFVDNTSNTWNLGTLIISPTSSAFTRFLTLAAGSNAGLTGATITVNSGGIMDFGVAYSGANIITVNSGGAIESRANAVLSTANVSFPSTGTVTLGGDDSGNGSIAISGAWPTLTGNLTINISQSQSHPDPVTFNNSFNLGTSNLTVATSYAYTGATTTNSATIAGQITGSGGIIKTSVGPLALSNAGNSYSGSTTIWAGNLQISGSGNIGDAASTNTININGGILESTANSYSLAANQTITLGAASTIQVDAGTLTLPQNISNGGYLLTLGGSGGMIVSGTISGAGGLTKSGTGSLFLTANNTYTGYTTLAGGLLNTNTAGINAGSAPSGIVFNSGTLQATTGSSVNTANTIFMTGAGTFDTNGSTSTLSGLIVGPGGLTKMGAGTLVLSDATSSGATFAGGLTINNGTVQDGGAGNRDLGSGNVTFGASNTPTLDLDGNNLTTGLLSGSANALVTDSVAASNTLTLAGTGSAAFQGVIQNGSGTVGLTILSGAQTLSGTNTYTGNTTINGGALVLDTGTNTTNNILNPGASSLVMNGGTLQLISRSGTNWEAVNGTTLDGAGIVSIDNLGTSGSLSLGAITRVAGGAVDFQSTQGSAALGDSSAIINTSNTNDASGILGAWATTGSGSALATVDASGNINAFTGYTTIAALGSTIPNNGDAGGGGGPSGVNGNIEITSAGTGASILLASATTSVETLTQASTTAATVNDANELLQTGTIGGIFITPGSAALTIGSAIDSGTLTAGGIAPNVAGEIILDNNSTNLLTINSIIANNGTGTVAVTKDGTGKVLLAGTNTFTGAIYVDAGTLQVSSNGNFGTTSGVTLNGGALDTSLATGGTFTPNIAIGPAGGAVSLSASSSNIYTGVISGAGTFTFTALGSNLGTLTWSNPLNSFTGPIVLEGGTIPQLYATTLSIGTSTANGITFTSTSGNGPVLGAASGGLITGKSLYFASAGELSAVNGNLVDTGVVYGSGQITILNNGTGNVVMLNNPNDDFTGAINLYGALNITTASLAQDSNGITFESNGSDLQAGVGGLSTNIAIHATNNDNLILDSDGYGMTLTGLINNGNGSSTLTKAGGGTVDLDYTGSETWTGGAVVVNAGTLQLDFSNGASSNMLSGTQSLTLGVASTSGGTLSIKGNPGSVVTSQTFASLTLANFSDDGITINPNGGTSTTLGIGGSWNVGTGASLVVNLTAPGTYNLPTNPTLTNGILGYALVETTSGTGFGTVSGGQLTVYNDAANATAFGPSTSSSTTNYTTLNSTYSGGVLALTTSGTTFANSLVVDTTNSGGTINIGTGNVLSLTTGALLFRGSDNETITGGQLGVSNIALIVHQVGAGTLTIDSPIGSNLGTTYYSSASVINSASLTKDGAGELIIGGTQTYAGPTVIGQGTLEFADVSTGITPVIIDGNGVALMGSATGLSQYNSVTFAAGATGSFQLNGNNVTIGSLNSPVDDASGPVVENGGSAPATLTLAGATAQTFYGVIENGGSGPLSLTLQGGSLNLYNAETYTGTTTINGGTLTIGNGAVGSLNGTTGTPLTFAGSGTFNVNEPSGVSQGMGALTLASGEAVIQSSYNGGAIDLNFSSLVALGQGATANFIVSSGVNGSTNEISFTTSPGAAGTLLNPGLFFSGTSYAVYDAGGFVRGLEYGTDANSPAPVTGTPSTFGVTSSATNIQYVASPVTTTSAVTTGITSTGANTLVVGPANISLFSVGEPISFPIESYANLIATGAPFNEYITAINTTTGTITVSEPILSGSLPLNYTVTGYGISAVSAQTTASLNTLNLNGSAASVVMASGTLSINGILRTNEGSGGVASVITGGSEILEPVTNDSLQISTPASTDTLIIGTPIVTYGTGGIVKSGSGTLVLQANNNYAGPTYIDSGVLQISGSGALGNNWATNGIYLGSGAVLESAQGSYSLGANQTIDLTGPATIESLSAGFQSSIQTLAINGNVDTNGNQLTIETNATINNIGVGNVAINGIISGGGGIYFYNVGNGYHVSPSLFLNSANSFSGPVILGGASNLGYVVISAASNLGNGSPTNYIVIGDADYLDSADGSYALGVNRSIDFSGGSIESDAGTLTINGNIEDPASAYFNGNGFIDVTGNIDNFTNTGNNYVIGRANGSGLLVLSGVDVLQTNNGAINNPGQLEIEAGTVQATNAALDTSFSGGTTTIRFYGSGNMTLQAGPGGLNTNSTKIIAFRGSSFNAYFDSNGSNSVISGEFENSTTTQSTGITFYKIGLGSLTLNPSSSYISGTTTGDTPLIALEVEGGTLTLDFTNITGNSPTNLWNPAEPLTVAGGTFDLNGKAGGSVVTSQSFSALTVSPGGGAGNIQLVNNGLSDTLIIGSATLTRTAGGTVNFIIPSGGGVTFSNAPTLTDGILGTWATTLINGVTSYATVSGGNVAAYSVLSGDNVTTFSGVTDTTGTGNWEVASGQSSGAGTGSLSGASLNTLDYAGAGGDTASGNFTANGFMNTGSGPLTMTGNVTIGANSELVIGGSSAITVSGNIANNGATASLLNYDGSSQLTLSGVNTFTGGIIINSGTVEFSGNEILPYSGLTIDGTGVALMGSSYGLGYYPSVTFGLATGGQFELNGNNVSLGSLTTLTNPSTPTQLLGTPAITNGASTNATLSLGATGNLYFMGQIQDGSGGGTLALNKVGAISTLTLLGTNSYSGGTTINGGGLILGDGLNGSGQSTYVLNGTIIGNVTLNSAYFQPFIFANPANQTFAGLISGASQGGVSKYGTGTESLTNSNTFTGVLQIYAGTINASTAGINGSNPTAGILFDNTAVSAGIPSSETSAPAASTVMYPATLQAASGGINTANTIFMLGSGYFDTNGFASTLSGSIVGGGTLYKEGVGVLTLSGSGGFGFTGGVTVADISMSGSATGTIQVGNSTALAGADVIMNVPNSFTFAGGIGTFGFGALSGTASESLMDANNQPINLTLWGNGTQQYFGNLSGTGASLTKAGTGIQYLYGVNSYTGPTSVTGGMLVMDSNMNGSLSTASQLVLGGGTFQYNGQPLANETQTMNGLAVNALGEVVVNDEGAANGATTTLNLSGTSGLMGITRTTGGTVDFEALTGTFGTNAIVETDQQNDATGILGAWATVNGGSNLAANAQSSGTGAIVPYSGYTSQGALGGMIASDATNNVEINTTGTSGNISLAGGAGTTNINTLVQDTSTAAIVSDTGDLNIGAGTASGVGAILMTGSASTTGGLTIGTAAGTGVLTSGSGGTWGTGAGSLGSVGEAGEIILDNNSGSALTINSVIANNTNATTALTVTGNGAGTVILNTANTFTGPILVSSGTLELVAGSNSVYTGLGQVLQAFSATQAYGSAANTLTLNGGALLLTFNTSWVAQNVAIGPDGGTIDTGDYFGGISGQLSGNGTLYVSLGNVSGSGDLQLLNANNTFTGPIVLTGTSAKTNDGFMMNTVTAGPATTNPITFTGYFPVLASGAGGLTTDRTLIIGPITSGGEATLSPLAGPFVFTGILEGSGELAAIANSNVDWDGVYLDGNGMGFTGGLDIGGDITINTLSIANSGGNLEMDNGVLQAGPGGYTTTGRYIQPQNPGIFDTNNSTMTFADGFNSGNSVLADQALTKIGLGTMDFDFSFATNSGNNFKGTGGITVNGGVLEFDFTNQSTTTGTSMFNSALAITLGGGDFEIVGHPGVATTTTAAADGTLTVNQGNNGLTVVPNGGLSTTLTIGNTWTRSVGASLLIDLSSPGTAVLASDPGSIASGTVIPYALVLDGSGEGFAMVNASGDVVRYNDQSGTMFAGNTSSATGNYTTYQSSYGASGTLTLATTGTTFANTLTIDTTSTNGVIDFGGTVLSAGGILFRGNSNETLQDGQLGISGSEVIIHQIGGGILNIAATIASPAATGTYAGSLTLDGTGTTIVRGDNTYTGATTINNGTIEAGASSVAGVSGTFGPFGVNSAVSISNTSTAVINLNGYNVSIGSLIGQAGSFDSTVELGENAYDANAGLNSSILLGSGTLTIGGLNATSVYGGAISGSGGVNEIGTGYLRLTGLNTYTGVTNLNSGTLTVSNLANAGVASSIGESGTLVMGTAELGYTGTANASTNMTLSILSGSTATIAVASEGTVLTLTGSSTNTASNLTIGTAGGNSNDFIGTVAVTGSLYYTGTTTITGYDPNNFLQGGWNYGGGTVLSVANLANGGIGSGIGAGGTASSYLVFNTGGLMYTGTSTSINRAFTLADNTTDNAIIISNPSTNLTFTNGVTNGGGNTEIDLYGPGTLTLAGGTYNMSDFDVSSGTLLVNGTLTGSSQVNSNDGYSVTATLGGSGLIQGNVQVLGILAPGGLNDASTGILTVNGLAQLLGGSTFAIDLNGSTPGSGYDQLSVTTAGDLSLSGDNNLALTIGPGFSPTSGVQYAIALESNTSSTPYASAFASLNGVPTNLTQGAIFTTSSDTFQISYRANGTTFDIGAGSGSIMLEDIGSYYWSGGATGGSWSVPANFTYDFGGTEPATQTPFAQTNVIFSTGTAITPITTTLDGSYTVNSLTFGEGAALSNPVTINPGSSGTNTLTIDAGGYNGNTVGNGITVDAGAAPDTINANVALGASQSWTTNSASPLTVNGVVSGAGTNLTISGTGTVALTAANTYTGTTTVSNGATLLVSGSLSGSTVVVANGGALISGSNTTADLGGASHPVSVYGTLDVGGTSGSVGELATGPLTLGTTGTQATLAMELGGTSAGAYDQIEVTPGSALNLANVTLQLSLINGYTPTNGDLLFLIIDAGSVNGAFANAGGNSITIGSQQFAVSYDASYSGDSFTGGDDVALMAVPEPDTWMLLFSGIGVLAFWRRSRRLRG